MSHTPIAQLPQHIDQAVTVAGWLTNLRSSGKIAFLQLRDGSGFVQGVAAKNDIGDELFERVRHLTQESSLLVHGTVRADERAPSGVELAVSDVELVGASSDYPQGARHRFPVRPPAPLPAPPGTVGRVAHPRRGGARRPRLLQ